MLIGGYNTHSFSNIHEESLRTQSVKGLWRWWLRAFIAGRYISQGYTHIESKVEEEVGKVLGYAGREGSLSSRLALRFTTHTVSCRRVEDELQRAIPRIKLLTLDKKELNYIESLTGSLTIWEFIYKGESVNRDSIKTGVLSLVSGLLLSGVGKGSRRGLGCLDFEIVEDKIGLPVSLKKRSLPGALRDVIREASSITRVKEVKNLPPISSIAPQFFKLWYIPYQGRSVEEVLTDLQRFTLRAERRKVIAVNGEDPFRRQLKAWILGLPRRIGGTGYHLPEKVERRASPLIFSVHRGFATASLFKSTEWPINITWRGMHQVGINVEKELDSAYNLLESQFLEYMEKKHYDIQEVRIW